MTLAVKKRCYSANCRIVLLVAACCFLISFFPGCKKDKTVNPNGNSEITFLVQDGKLPVWMPDGIRFLHTYDEAADKSGIYLSAADGTEIAAIWESGHNHDYSPSPDGRFIAFSIPGDEGGIYIYDLDGGNAAFEITGKNPSWIANSAEIVAENVSGGLFHYVLGSETFELLVEEGRYPVCSPQGNDVAYLHPSEVYGFHLRVMDIEELSIVQNLVSYAGSDMSWDRNGEFLFATHFTPDNPGSIVRVDPQNPSGIETIISDATTPRIAAGGEYLLAVDLDGDRANGILRYTFSEERITKIYSDGSFPAPHPTQNTALIEKDDGIYLLAW
ncbi:MAG: hypothetical protein P9L92_16910 [Candidatus Electryonea clarkiae]|nr:hypothetical protein [Candidatus Electryonea clarkiae]MDP8289237.1 hypothetical protein [Candidatus Electryonea clarkiae]